MSVEPIPSISKRRARREAWCAAAIDTLLLFRQRFPLAFARLSASTRRPLKVGIDRDIAIAMPEIGIVEIKSALRWYCGDLRYHRACTEGADRLDLDGNVAGAVTTAQAVSAKATIAKRQAQRARPTPPAPKRLSLASLREAAAMRKLQGTGQ
jgi:ProP effector